MKNAIRNIILSKRGMRLLPRGIPPRPLPGIPPRVPPGEGAQLPEGPGTQIEEGDITSGMMNAIAAMVKRILSGV